MRDCAGIVVDVHLFPREWIELFQRRSTSLWSDVDESEDEDCLKEHVSASRMSSITPNIIDPVEEKPKAVIEHTPSRREVIDAHRRALIDKAMHQELWHEIIPKMGTHS